ncbi:MAG: 3-hydroxypropionyl-coenzyme A synthetase [Candidatus Heimdallarchaeota archaeon LC_3]|nr:MAG: 3-hydroxypropionyl-coenzyme A synthetase [Candidatus Heimdallarchaeota archaeon LC_3]
MAKLLWKPTEERINSSNITIFISKINKKFNLKIKDYYDLYQWSVDNIGDFWGMMWDFGAIKYSKKYDKIVKNLSSFQPDTTWFPGSKLNFAENLLKFNDNKIALISINEKQERKQFTYSELNRFVTKLARSFKEHGILPGDRIVGYMSNIAETVIAMLATTSLGGIWSSCGSELGANAVVDRFSQVEPKILIASNGYYYKGKKINLIKTVQNISNGIPTLEKVVLVQNINDDVTSTGINNSTTFDEFTANNAIKESSFEQLPFDHPLYIMFSSGTTGKPKCIAQSAGGVLINHLKELILHTDLKRSDKILYITSPSWMMWNWLVSSLAVGATVVLFDGNPVYPDWKSIWEIIEKEQVTIFGCSATYVNFLRTNKYSPKKEFNLTHLREISQTGSSLSEEGFEFIYTDIKEDLHFNSISGGTDINGCFAGGSPILPVYAGELQGSGLGMKIFAYDQNGEPIEDSEGELVCEIASPSMPIYFWNDENHEKYRKAYFQSFQNKSVWRHGDYIKINSKTGGITFYGRSDAILKPSGVRIGTSEIYRIIEQIEGISDSLAIGQEWHNDQRIILFIKLLEGHELTEELEKTIKTNLRKFASPRHVPQIILKTPDIPYTFSGKKVEIAVTNILHNRPVTNKDALSNPESLDYYEHIKSELK